MVTVLMSESHNDNWSFSSVIIPEHGCPPSYRFLLLNIRADDNAIATTQVYSYTHAHCFVGGNHILRQFIHCRGSVNIIRL